MAKHQFTLNDRYQSFPTINPAHWQQEQSKGGLSFQFLSISIHGLLLASTFWLPSIIPQREVIEFEITETQLTTPAPAPALAPEVKTETPAPVAAANEPIAKPAIVKTPKASQPKAPKVAAAVAAAVTQTDADVEEETPLPEFNPDDLDETLDQVDVSNADAEESMKELGEDMDQLAEDLEAQKDETLKALAAETQKNAEAEALARKKALAQEIARARWQRDQEAKAAAQAAAARASAAKAAAAASADKSAQAARQQSALNGSGTGQGNVRKLSQLRQMPGNKKPMYDVPDRMAGKEGRVSLVAYIGSTGSIQKIKMLQSSGHRTLDQKTLFAIQQWRFYPGQEGWVEIPFEWTLKGDLQEKPTQLRRQVQR